MIKIAMNSKGSVNHNSLLSINKQRVCGSLTSRNIMNLNQPARQQAAHANTPRPAQAAHPAAPRQGRAAAPAVPRPSRAAAPAASVPAAAPARRPLPALVKPVQKGQKAPLAVDPHSGVLKACFGWNTTHSQCDADVSAFLLGADGKVIGDSWFVFYGQTESPDHSCRFQSAHHTDREIITVDFKKLNRDVKKIVFVLTIDEAFERRLHFGMMQDAYIRILDERGMECVSFLMTEYYSNVVSMMIGEIYQYNGSWKFNAVGNGVARDLAGLCALYGVEVSD